MKTMQFLKQSFKIYLLVLIFISVLNTSMCFLDDLLDNNNTIKTENIQSLEEKTEEPLKLNNQISFFRDESNNLNSKLVSFLPNSIGFIDDDDNQIDAQDALFIAESGYQDKSSLFKNYDSPETSSKIDKNSFVDEKDFNDKEFSDKLYSDVIKTKKFTKTCQCSFTNEDDITFFDYNLDLQKKPDEYQINEIYKEPIKNFENTEYLKNFDKRNFLQNDNRDDDDDMSKLTKFNYKRSFTDNKQEICDENFSNEELRKNKFEIKLNEELDNDLNKQVDDLDENYFRKDKLDDDLNENLDIKDSAESYEIDIVNNSNNLKNLEEAKEKIYLPFITNLSPTSSSELILNELNIKTKQLDNQLNQNSFQLEKLKNVIQEEFLKSENETAIEKNDVQENDLSNTSSFKKFISMNDDSSKSTNKKKNFFNQFLARNKRKAINSIDSFIGTTAKSLL